MDHHGITSEILLVKLRQHTCKLIPEPDLIDNYIYRGNYVGLRRKLRKILTISDTHIMSKKLFKSRAAICAERARHLYNYYYTIHPFSSFKMFWEFWMVLVFMWEFVLTPLYVCRNSEIAKGTSIAKIFADIWCAFDILLRFCCGYYDYKNHRVILNNRKICTNYLFGFFLVDFVSNIPWTIIFQTTEAIDDSLRQQNLVIEILLLGKLARVSTFVKYLNNIRDYKGINSFGFYLIKLVTILGLVLFWAACFVFLLYNIKDHTWLPEQEQFGMSISYALLKCLYRAMLPMFLVQYGDTPSDDIIDMFFIICLLCVGIVGQMYLLAEILTVRNKAAISTDKYSQLIQQLEEFMQFKELSINVRQRIMFYFEFRFQKQVFKEDYLLSTLSPLLVQEILMYQCRKLMDKVSLFKQLPMDMLYKLAKSLKSEIFLPNDIIVQAHSAGQAMYFIYIGTVAIYTSTGKEICHLTDGAHFGEIALVLNIVRTAYVVAVDACELLRLTRRDFLDAIQDNQVILGRLRDEATERIAQTKSLENSPSNFKPFDNSRPSSRFMKAITPS